MASPLPFSGLFFAPFGAVFLRLVVSVLVLPTDFLKIFFRGFFRSIRSGIFLSFFGLLAVIFVSFSGAFFLLFFLWFFRGFLPFQNRWKSSGLGENGKGRKRAVKKRKSKCYGKIQIVDNFFILDDFKGRKWTKNKILRSNFYKCVALPHLFLSPFLFRFGAERD